MDRDLRALLERLEAAGLEHDEREHDRARRMLNITADTGEFLRALIVSGRHRRILELGTSNGYSTIWLADAARAVDGHVVSIERDRAKHGMAVRTLEEAGLAEVVELRLAEIADELPGLRDFDLVFLDSERIDYPDWWPQLQRPLSSPRLRSRRSAGGRRGRGSGPSGSRRPHTRRRPRPRP